MRDAAGVARDGSATSAGMQSPGSRTDGANVYPARLAWSNAVAVLVGVTVGSGIFRVPATVAAQLHDPGPVILCWILGGVIALFRRAHDRRARGRAASLGRHLRLSSGEFRAASGIYVRLDRAGCRARIGARCDGNHLRGVPRIFRTDEPFAGPVRSGGGDRTDRC